MVVVVCEIELFVPEANSLKTKRRVVKSIIERIKSRCNASVAETDFQDVWQRSTVAVAMVGTSRVVLEQQVETVRRIADEVDGGLVAAFEVEFI